MYEKGHATQDAMINALNLVGYNLSLYLVVVT